MKFGLHALFCLLLIGLPRITYSQQDVWVPDNTDGTYSNPIIHADYSDPDVIRVRDDFYLISSSFNAAPGLPILHSRDLVNWKIVAHVFQQQIPRSVFSKPQHGKGVWAPAIRYHDGSFYVYYPDPDFGIYLSKATSAAAPWSEPLLIKSAKGWIDPCPFWDTDGKAYLVHAWANSRSGIKSLLTIHRMSADGTQILDEGRTIFDGRVHQPTIEGPKLYKRNGYYYIFAPAGGVPTGWQTVLRSRNIYGPYQARVVMDQGKTRINGPHQGAWVQLQSGESWFLHFQDKGPYGRVVHLEPLQWRNNWPVIGRDRNRDGKGEPVSNYKKPNVGRKYQVEVPQTNDEFDSSDIGLQWQWHANFDDKWWTLSERPGWLRLNSVTLPLEAVNLWPVSNLLLQKLPAPSFTLTTRIDANNLLPNEESGLVLMGMNYSYLAVVRTDSGFRLEKTVCKDAHSGVEESEEAGLNIESGLLHLRMTMTEDGVARFSFSSDGKKFVDIGEPFKARQGKWIGAKVGLFTLAMSETAQHGHADFDWFRFEK